MPKTLLNLEVTNIIKQLKSQYKLMRNIEKKKLKYYYLHYPRAEVRTNPFLLLLRAFYACIHGKFGYFCCVCRVCSRVHKIHRAGGGNHC